MEDGRDVDAVDVIIKSKYMKSETIQFHMFQFVSILFLIYFLYDTYSHSAVDALEDTLTEYAMISIATPIPGIGVMTALPIKLFFNVPIHISYIFIVFLSFFVLFHFNSHDSSFVQHILQTKTYSIFIISILSTGIISKLMDSGIEYIVNRKPVQHLVPMIVASTLLIGVYYYQIHQMMKIE